MKKDTADSGSDRIRIIDIAQKLHVSTATVSNVLHGKTRKISMETVELVTRELEDARYLPKAARLLMGDNTARLVAVVINDHQKYEGNALSDPFIAACVNALCRECEKSGFFMLVRVVPETDGIQRLNRLASMWNLEGMILIGFCEQDYQKLRARITIPLVIFDGFFCDRTSLKKYRLVNILADNAKGGRLVAEHFNAAGCTRALLVSDNDICMDLQRMEGFERTFCGTSRRVIIPKEKAGRESFFAEQQGLFEDCDCVFAVSDVYAMEVLRFLQGQKIPVPGKIRVAGFDGTPQGEQSSPRLTSVRQDTEARAARALQKLAMLKNGGCGGEEVLLDVSLCVRESG